MAVIETRPRLVRIGGLPLMTPAWHCVDMSEVYDGPTSRGSDVLLPYGQAIMTRRFAGPARKALPMVIWGTHDEEGNEHDDIRLGLLANLNTLKRALRIRSRTTSVLFEVEFEEASPLDGPWVLNAPCSVNWPLQVAARGPSLLRCVIDVTIPGGVLRDTVPVGRALQTNGDHTVANPGTAEQFAVTLTIPTATTLVNKSWGNHTLTYTGTDPITVNTANGTAVYADGTTALGLVQWPGPSENMFPLVVGDNVINVDSASPNVGLTHYPPYA